MQSLDRPINKPNLILNTHLPVKAWLDPQTARLPGVRPVATSDWLTQSDTYEAQMAYRRALMTAKREIVFQSMPEADAASDELRDMICKEGNLPKSENCHPLLDAASHIQEDLCVLQKIGEEHILTAAVMCFPSSWDVRQKIGRSISSIHEPVPEFSDVENIVERMLSSIRIEQPLGRANFLIYTDPELHQPRGEGIAKPIDLTAPRYIRVERQTFRRLPKTRAVIFAIHTYIVPESALPKDELAILAEFKPELKKITTISDRIHAGSDRRVFMKKRVKHFASMALCGLSLMVTAGFASDASAQTQYPDYSRLSALDLQRLANQGDMHALFTQGYNLIFDETMRLRVNPEFAKAKALLERAHQGGHENANSILMLYYQGEFGGQPDPVKLENLLLTSAQRGSAVAQLNYASNFIYSDVASQSSKALQFLTRASTDATVAENALPMLIEVLYGTDSDEHRNLPLARQKAQDCVRRFAQNPFCHFILGQDFGNGWTGSVDKTKSDFHFLKAAEAGDARAQWQIGMYHLNGERVPKNEKTAYYWVKKSADQGYVEGLISFAVMNAVGQGTAVNKMAAFQAYEKAASLGSAHALRGLGAMYCSGEAPKTDRDLCAAALILAYEMEDDLSANLLTHFFDVQDQAGFDALKNKTEAARSNLAKQYDIPL